jgi:hypothetical protein
MFEFHFEGEETYEGTTSDFLEVVCQIAQFFDQSVAGFYVAALLEDKVKELPYLRVIDWKFDLTLGEKVIRVHKVV